MNKENTGQGFGLAVASFILLLAGFITTFYFKKCIPGTIISIVAATLSAFAFIEARRGGGPRKFALTILIIAWLGAIFAVVWTASGTKRAEKMEAPTEEEIIINEEQELDKEEKLKELEKKAEQFEKVQDTLN